MNTNNQRSVIVEVSRILQSLSQNLDDEICNALAEDNNELAERLNAQFMRVKKLAKELKNTTGVATTLKA